MATSTPVYKTRTQMVMEAIREQILSGELQAGEPLRQDALAKAFHVSRIPVREALMQLEVQGLVKFEAHRGAIVTELSAAEIEELFSLRVLIECDILAHSIDRMTDAHFADAEQILSEFDHALETGSQREHWSRLNHAFHTSLYVAADRPTTMEVIDSINTNCDRYIRMELSLTDRISDAEQEHKALLGLCRQRDKAGAVALLKQHFENAAASIKALLHQGTAK